MMAAHVSWLRPLLLLLAVVCSVLAGDAALSHQPGQSIDEILAAIKNGDSAGRPVGGGGVGQSAGLASSTLEPTLAPEPSPADSEAVPADLPTDSEAAPAESPPDSDAVPAESPTDSDVVPTDLPTDSEVPADSTITGGVLPPTEHPVATPAPVIAGEQANDVVSAIKQGGGLTGGRLPVTQSPTAEDTEPSEWCIGSLCVPAISWASSKSVDDTTLAPTTNSDTAVASGTVGAASGAAAGDQVTPVGTTLVTQAPVKRLASTEAPTPPPATLASGDTTTMFWIGGGQPAATELAAVQTVAPQAVVPPTTTGEESSSSSGSSSAGSSAAFWIIFAIMLCCCCVAAVAAVGMMLMGGKKKKKKTRDVEMDGGPYVSTEYTPVMTQEAPVFAEEAPALREEHATLPPVAVASPPVADVFVSQPGVGAPLLQPSSFQTMHPTMAPMVQPGTVQPASLMSGVGMLQQSQPAAPGMFVFR